MVVLLTGSKDALEITQQATSNSAGNMNSEIEQLASSTCNLLIEPLLDGRRRLVVQPRSGLFVPRREWITAYSLPLIREIFAIKDSWICDEIMREEDPRYVEHSIRHEILSYIEPSAFAGKRILDFGSGAGASAMVLTRLLPACDIVGIELLERLLHIARLRAEFYDARKVQFLQSPSGDSFPAGIGDFDYVIFSAVFEHLLPSERTLLLCKVWRHLRPGGILFLNQTPHRWAPYENHTTKLPLINYLPDALALRAARRFSRLIGPKAEWEELLRAGIRGGSVREILTTLRSVGEPVLLRPAARVGDRVDLWYGSLSSRHRWFKRSIWASLKLLKATTTIEMVPELSLAIRKDA